MSPSALQAALIENRPMLLRLLAARLGSPDDAEDAFQELWLKVARFDGGEVAQPASFLFRMAANLATDRRIAVARRTARDGAWFDVQPEAGEFADPERQLLARREMAVVEDAVASMPERMRTALTMFRLEEQPHRLIAQRLGITVSGVEKLLRRAYRTLHDAVAEADGAEEALPHRLDGGRRADHGQ